MFERAKRTIVHSLNRVGFTFRRHRDPWAAQRRILADREVKTIFDLGANVGEVTAIYTQP